MTFKGLKVIVIYKLYLVIFFHGNLNDLSIFKL